MRLHKFLLAAIAILSVAATANADVVEFDFETDDTANPAFAAAIDSDFTGTQDGITFTASATSTMGTTVPNTAGSGLGVNSDVAGDQASSIDPGEILTLTVTFDPAAFTSVQLANIDLGNLGAPGDGGDVTFPDGSVVTFLDAATAPAGFEFNAGTDIITVNRDTNPINLNSGDAFVFNTPAGQTDGEFRVQRISLHLTPAIPEPSSLALLGLLGGVVAIRRRR